MNSINKCFYKKVSQKKSCCNIFRWRNKHIYNNNIKIKKAMMKNMRDTSMILIIQNIYTNNIKKMMIKSKIPIKIKKIIIIKK